MNQTWCYSKRHDCICKIIDEQKLWGQIIYRVWLPSKDAVVRVPKDQICSLDDQTDIKKISYQIKYTVSAAKVAEVLESSSHADEGHILLAPIDSQVIPLPHQIHALSRAISRDNIRYLLADEVGLGKTIEAGLILRELKLRGLVRRTLVVSPKSIALQWVAEMRTHFNEQFSLVNPNDFQVLRRLNGFSMENPWVQFSQAIVTLDAVKPITKRRGWSQEKIQEYNDIRYEKLIDVGWDLIIVDESHKLGGSTDQVARFKLGKGLAEAAPYLLLLSATPHQGKSDSFHRLMSLLDPMVFPDEFSVTRDRVAQFVIRTEKRKAVNAKGDPLFRPRTTRTISVDMSVNHMQVALYQEVTDYVKRGYNQAIKDKKPHVGFLMVLLQRIVTSSTYAICCTLERRLEVLKNLGAVENAVQDYDAEQLSDMDGQEQLDTLITIYEKGKKQEIAQVSYLLDLAREAEAFGLDSKTTQLFDIINTLQIDERDDELKFLIFTEFIPTQEMLKQFLEGRGILCTTLNGSMSMDERIAAQKQFRDHVRVLISTDAGGEGLNLQFCHIIINYDLPWNPMRIEQRIGRVDRIGQEKTVKAINLVYEDSVEQRVREVLEQKLAIIFDEIGIDKTNDVLESAYSGEMVEKMMARVIMEDSDPEFAVTDTFAAIKQEVSAIRRSCAVYSVSDDPNIKAAEQLRTHPLPFWIERMVISYLYMHGCKVKKHRIDWDITWPDGEVTPHVRFTAGSGDGSTVLTLEDPRVRGMVLSVPTYTKGQHIPSVMISEMPSGISGYWGLFEISIAVNTNVKNSHMKIPMERKRYHCVFVTYEGKVFIPTARHIWDLLQTGEPQIIDTVNSEKTDAVYELIMDAGMQTGKNLYEELQRKHEQALKQEKERGDIAFESRKRSIERVGLPEVRQYRMKKCEQEESEWEKEITAAKTILPEIRPLLMLHVVEVSI